jgi:ubiquitin-conjugating enzyme E2 I
LLKDEPNIESPAQYDPCNLFKNNREVYTKNAKEFAAANRKKL